MTDFTTVDPHLGTDADFKAFVDAAHAKGMKVYMDIIANHTADVLYPKECEEIVLYRSIADYPYQRRGGTGGPAINTGFDGSNFDKLTDPNYAYSMTVKPSGRAAKIPPGSTSRSIITTAATRRSRRSPARWAISWASTTSSPSIRASSTG